MIASAHIENSVEENFFQNVIKVNYIYKNQIKYKLKNDI